MKIFIHFTSSISFGSVLPILSFIKKEIFSDLTESKNDIKNLKIKKNGEFE